MAEDVSRRVHCSGKPFKSKCHAARQRDARKNVRDRTDGCGDAYHTYREGSAYGIKTDVDLVHKVGGVAYAHQGAPAVNVVLPSVELFVILEREVEAFVLGFKEETVGLKVDAFDGGDIFEVQEGGLRSVLFLLGTKEDQISI